MSQKMQQLLDLLVNEEMDKANELFHEIVVEKSREIYENLIAEEADDDLEEEMDEAAEDADDSVEEGFGDEPESDSADNFVAGVEAPQAHDEFSSDDGMGDEEDGGAPATKDDVQDLEDALAELKAEFEALMGGSTGDNSEEDEFDSEEEPEEEPEDGDEKSPFDDEEAEEEEYEESMGVVREYRETVGNDWEKNSMKTPGPVGSGKGDKAGQTSVEGSKSIVASGKGKPTTGANANNILGDQSTGEGTNVGTTPNGKTGGLAGNVKGQFTKGVEKNIAGSASTKMKSGSDLAKNGAGHGAERKGSGPGPVGSGSGDKAGQTSVGQVKSPLNGAPNRNA
jgi:hypothetical protein